jgi:trehalose 6-phosphate phosphatase
VGRSAAGRRRPAVEVAHEDLRADPAIQDSGAYIEDKGYAVAVHTRRIADPTGWAVPIDRAAREIAARHGFEVVPGKLVWELRPAVASDKGDAVRRVIIDSGARSVVVAGDDLGDLAAFAAASRIDADGLRIAVRSAEAPPALLAAADLIVDGPTGLRQFLKRLLT